jgi:RNA polymerase sigma-70 factor (ECF subfamily)
MVEEAASETAEGLFSEAGTENVAEQVALGDAVGRALSQLSKEHAACLILHYHQGFSYAEAADILELPLTTFKMRLYRARQAFQQLYQAEEAKSRAELGLLPG